MFKYLESEVSTGEGDGVEVDARLQVVRTQHGDTLIKSRLFQNKSSGSVASHNLEAFYS